MKTDQAIHELKMGRAIKIGGQAYLHPEYAANLPKNAKLIITKNRAAALGFTGYKNNTSVELKGKTIADVQLIIAGTYKKKLQLTAAKETDAITKFAAKNELLPTLIQFKTTKKLPSLSKLQFSTSNLQLVTRAPLNLRDCGKAEIVAFRDGVKQSEHFAIIVGKPSSQPLVRVHSCCYTGDLLGSLACDCNDQLRGALDMMHKNDGGILVYLMQEGRGIGLINKLRAYQLQAGGMDTVQANEFLGFDDEERGFEIAAAILKQLKVKKINLISNNPKKAKELEKEGIAVAKLVPILIVHQHNAHYLQTKAKKSGHIIKQLID